MAKKTTDWDEVFDQELREIAKRRDVGEQAARQSLVGLAISGGGIRSATFALGVLESLKNCGLLNRIDYLSTVSGGGYIGAWLSANCHRQDSWLQPDDDWKLSIDHLRRYSNYLSPSLGFFSADTWSIATIWLRNTLLVQLTVIIAIACVLLVPRLAYLGFKYWPGVGEWRWTTILLFVLGAVGIAGNLLRLSRNNRDVPILKYHFWSKGAIVSGVALGLAVLIGIIYDFEAFSNKAMHLWPAVPIALLLLVGGFFLQPIAVKLVHDYWRGRDKPVQINYTQTFAQWLVVIPMMIVGVLVAAILWGESQQGFGVLSQQETFGQFFTTAWQYWPFPLAVVFGSLWMFAICSIHDVEFSKWRCWVGALLASFPAMVVLHALLCAIMLLLHGWAAKPPEEGAWLAFVWTPPLVLYAFALSIVILIGMLGRESTEGVREWWSRFGAWLGIYGFAWMLVNVAAVYGPWLSATLIVAGTAGASAGGLGWVATTIAGLFAGNSESTGKSSTEQKSTMTSALELVARIAPFVFIGGLLVGVSSVLHLAIVSNSNFDWTDAGQLKLGHWYFMENAHLPVTLAILAVCLIALFALAGRVDINEFSLNSFYRNRLVRCYLGATRFEPGARNPQHFTGFDDNDDVQLSDLQGTNGPFHIVNCALNLGGSKDLALHTRHSAIFTLSPLFCGTSYKNRGQDNKEVEIGYFPTARYTGRDGPSIGQAIAVSGAAASPNMGYHTSPVVAFLMTLFNVRLGWWFPSPSTKSVNNPSPGFSFQYLIMELFGVADDKSAYFDISDGGHFENMAVYELIKRQCKLIILSDGECDPKLQFEGLGTLIRVALVDFEAKITIDVNSIRPGDSLWSDRRCAVGTIDYKGGAKGTLVYLKASMTGEEESDILQYKSVHATFPHESTGNQFYTEDQFESYRGLGSDIAKKTFQSVQVEIANGDMDGVAGKLVNIFSPSLHDANQFARHGQRLMDLWSKLSDNSDLTFLDHKFEESLPNVSKAHTRSAFYLCYQIIQFMENVYLDLRLEETWEHVDNAGWRTTFQQWADSPVIKRTWEITHNTYGLRFQYFCERNLKLPITLKAASARR